MNTIDTTKRGRGRPVLSTAEKLARAAARDAARAAGTYVKTAGRPSRAELAARAESKTVFERDWAVSHPLDTPEMRAGWAAIAKQSDIATEEYLDDITPPPEVLEMIPEHKLSQQSRDKRDEMIMEGLG